VLEFSAHDAAALLGVLRGGDRGWRTGLQLAEHMWAAVPWRGSWRPWHRAGVGLCGCTGGTRSFLEALERRLVAQFWDSFGRTVVVQRRFDQLYSRLSLPTLIGSCAVYDVGSCICLPGRFRGRLVISPVWMLSPGVCSVHRIEVTKSSLQDGPFGRKGHPHRQSGCSGSFERLGDTAKAVAGVLRVEAVRAGRLHRELWRLLCRCGRL